MTDTATLSPVLATIAERLKLPMQKTSQRLHLPAAPPGGHCTVDVVFVNGTERPTLQVWHSHTVTVLELTDATIALAAYDYCGEEIHHPGLPQKNLPMPYDTFVDAWPEDLREIKAFLVKALDVNVMKKAA